MSQPKPKPKTKTAAARRGKPPTLEMFDFCDGVTEPDGEPAVFTIKEKFFVFYYLTDANFVATDAARQAGYDAKSDNAFRVIACELMKRPRVRAAINAGLEAMTMPKFENLYRLARQAKGTLDDVLDEAGNFNVAKSRQNGSIHLIQSIEITETIVDTTSETNEKPGDLNLPKDERPEREVLETTTTLRKTKLRMYSSQNALKILTEINFARKHELTGADGGELIPKESSVLILPDNGRGDSPKAVAAKRKATVRQPDGKKTTRKPGATRKAR